jgi:hypothetical protein
MIELREGKNSSTLTSGRTFHFFLFCVVKNRFQNGEEEEMMGSGNIEVFVFFLLSPKNGSVRTAFFFPPETGCTKHPP